MNRTEREKGKRERMKDRKRYKEWGRKRDRTRKIEQEIKNRVKEK